jgi:hypothetical protein
MGPLPLTLLALASVATVIWVVTLRPGRVVRVATDLMSHALRSNRLAAVLDPAESVRETFTA